MLRKSEEETQIRKQGLHSLQLQKRILRILKISSALMIPFVVILATHLYDVENQLAKTIVLADFYITIMDDFCKLEYDPACNYMNKYQDEIRLIRSYDWVLLDFEKYKEEWLDSHEYSKLLKYWMENRHSIGLEFA